MNNKEENDEELWAEIYFLRSKAYINMNKIESGLNDLNKFFELIDNEKNKIKENLDKVKNNKNNKDNNKGKGEYDIEKILYQKYDISDAHFKRGFCYFNLLDYNEALKEFGDIMDWDEIFMEGYCVLNPEAKVAQLTEAKCDLTEDDVIAYARLADKLLHLPIFYLEYSGTYGDVELVKNVKAELKQAKLYYGGGISNAEQAKEMAQYADTVVVGNIIYDDIKSALKTVKAVKGE